MIRNGANENTGQQSPLWRKARSNQRNTVGSIDSNMRHTARILLATLIASLFIACAASTTVSGVVDPGQIKEAQVVRVIDGDTLDVLITGTKHRVRLFGVDTPERGERCYQEATERTRQLSGNIVRIESGPRSED